jgi:hypothetical protein
MKPREFASACRGSLNAPPCPCNELARIVRAILRTFPSLPRRGKRGPENQEPRRAGLLCSGAYGRAALASGSLCIAAAAVENARRGGAMDRADFAACTWTCSQRSPTADADPLGRSPKAQCFRACSLWRLSHAPRESKLSRSLARARESDPLVRRMSGSCCF